MILFALNQQHLAEYLANIVSINILVQSGNEPITEAVLNKFYDAIWCH